MGQKEITTVHLEFSRRGGRQATMGSIPEGEKPPFHLTDVDRAVLAQTDHQFHLQTWDDLKCIIGASGLRLLVGTLMLTIT